MIKKNSFDTICHEHLEYYSLKQIHYLAKNNNLQIINATINDANGGSVRIFVSHKNSIYKIDRKNLLKFSNLESKLKLNKLKTYENFISKISNIKEKTKKFITKEINSGKKIFIYGASTKGNTLLQYYEIDSSIIKYAAERNPNKYNKVIPGTGIKIISEKKARSFKPDYFLVLPWHFKKEICNREKEFLSNGGGLIFPLPTLQVVKLK